AAWARRTQPQDATVDSVAYAICARQSPARVREPDQPLNDRMPHPGTEPPAGQAGWVPPSSASPAVSGSATVSRLARSAFTAKNRATTPPRDITPAPTKNAIDIIPRSPVATRFPNSVGPAMPPTAVPIA